MEESSDRCTAQLANGRFCDTQSIPDAPFPICPHHARKAYEFGAQLRKSAALFTQEAFDSYSTPAFRRKRYRTSPRPCVYFLQVGEHIKIGTTVNLAARMRGYPPTSEVLFVVYTADAASALRLEGKYLRKFAEHLVAGNEWFADVAEIRSFIADLREQARTADLAEGMA